MLPSLECSQKLTPQIDHDYIDHNEIDLGPDDDESVVRDLLQLRREVVPRHEALDVLGRVLHVELGRLELLLQQQCEDVFHGNLSAKLTRWKNQLQDLRQNIGMGIMGFTGFCR